MSNQQSLKECDRLKIIVEFIKTGKVPEVFNVKEDGNGGFRVSTIKVKDPAVENNKKRAKLLKKLIDIDPSLSEIFNEIGNESTTESGTVEEELTPTEE